MRYLPALGAFIAVMACSSTDPVLTLEDIDVVELRERRDAAAPATEDDLQGQAVLTGYFAVNDTTDDPVILIGAISLNADFETSKITGTVTDIGEYEGACTGPADCDWVSSFDGALNIDGNIGGDAISADLSGTISGNYEDTALGNGTFEAVADGMIDGQFETDSQGLIASGDTSGTFDVTVTIGETSETETISFEGGYLAGE